LQQHVGTSSTRSRPTVVAGAIVAARITAAAADGDGDAVSRRILLLAASSPDVFLVF
jgi:hypothetical protein